MNEPGLDPADWTALRALAHTMLDDLFDDFAALRNEPVWRQMPASGRAAWAEPLPAGATPMEAVYAAYRERIAPYGVGNRHPRFLGWVHGGGTAVGALAEMLAAGLNANCGDRDHAPILVERQVVRWAAQMLGLPEDAGGVLLTGTSIANFAAVLTARRAALGDGVRTGGVTAARLTGYASADAHMCVARAFDMAGLGSGMLRRVPTDRDHRIRLDSLGAMIATDRAAGLTPFLVAGTAGSVDIGAIDDLAALATLCRAEQLWFHVDAAFGAVAMLSPRLRPLFAGMECADSVAFDFHKWAQVPYDAGCLVVRREGDLRAAFARPADYLGRAERGLAGGDPWPVDLGPDLSRGFRALKVWITLKVYGAAALGGVAERGVALAQRLAGRIDADDRFERAAPVPLNIVCFRHRHVPESEQAEIVADLQEAGEVVLSMTRLDGRPAMRAAFINHRTTEQDADAVVEAVARAAERRRRV